MMRRLWPWLGLLLMVASFVWLQLYPDTWIPPAPNAMGTATAPEAISLVVLDPGHGGQDSGVMAAGMLEKDLTLDVAKRVERLVRLKGLPALLTREGDDYISLENRAAVANREHDCVFVSIHFNEGKRPVATGVETYYASHVASPFPAVSSWLPFLQRTAEPPDPESQSLAGFIQEALVSQTQALNRGTKAEQFFVIANVKHPAVLVEGGFLTNKDEVGKLGSPEYREQIATAITDGITRYRDVVRQRPGLASTAPRD
ncbi:MAG: N-acetylmuramoyl-L-alanine amidase [Verrucomicrobiota bacterium]